MSDAKLLPQPQSWSSSTNSLKLKRRVTAKNLAALAQLFSGFPRRVERAYRDLELKVRFFEAGDYAPQEYKLEIAQGGVIVYAGDARGLYYGHQTLRQILSQCTTTLPCCIVEDTPAFPRRAFHLDLSVQRFKPAYIRKVFDGLARLRYTDVFVQYHDTFPFKKHPAIQGSVAYSDEQIKEIDRAAEDHGLTLVPVQPVFDQLGYVLGLQFHAGLALPDDPSRIDYRQPAARKLIESMLDDLCALHGSGAIYLGALPLGCDADGDEAGAVNGFADYLAHLVEYVARRGQSVILSDALARRGPAAVRKMPKGSAVAVDATSAAFEKRSADHRRKGVGVLAVLPSRHPGDDELQRCVEATVALSTTGAGAAVAAEADGIVVSSRSSRHERLCEPVFGTPLEAMDGARRMHLATTWFTVAAAAEAAWNPSRFDLQRLTATWPLFWFGVDDKRFSDLALLDQRSATHGTSHAEVLRDCRRIVKLCDELEPRDHADTLALCSFYARLGIHSVHVRQAFSRSTRKQQVTLLASEAERLKELLKTVMHDSLYRTGVSEEQHYLFQHAEILLKRLQRRL